MNSERTAQLQVALASYDLKELRVQKRYLQEQGTAIDCTCFCSGEKLLAQLRQGVRYDAVVLCSELTDLPAEQFVRQFYQLKERPMLLIQSHGRSSGTALQKLREGCYCVDARAAEPAAGAAGQPAVCGVGHPAGGCQRRISILRGRHRMQHQPEAGDPQGNLAGGERAV